MPTDLALRRGPAIGAKEATMGTRSLRAIRTGRFWSPGVMRDELSHALVEALYELDVLPEQDDAALVGLYAVMDDLQLAIRRTEALDLAQSA
jgi:hypothetical protein